MKHGNNVHCSTLELASVSFSTTNYHVLHTQFLLFSLWPANGTTQTLGLQNSQVIGQLFCEDSTQF